MVVRKFDDEAELKFTTEDDAIDELDISELDIITYGDEIGVADCCKLGSKEVDENSTTLDVIKDV